MFHRFTKSRKRTIASLTVVAVLGIAGAAIAYFTTTGSGTGTAGVGSSTALTITQTGTVSNLTPAGPAQSVLYTINNPSANGNQTLGVVSATVASVTPTTGNTCATSNFTTAPATTAVGAIAGGTTFNSGPAGSATEPTVQMIDTGQNQNGCQGATVNLTLSAAQGS